MMYLSEYIEPFVESNKNDDILITLKCSVLRDDWEGYKYKFDDYFYKAERDENGDDVYVVTLCENIPYLEFIKDLKKNGAGSKEYHICEGYLLWSVNITVKDNKPLLTLETWAES